ncbi:MAG: hypothetical protein J6331_09315, partial [Lentisphaeria bacterium]|nr:hypothetical protein [Lentisphaeria bacterium]
FLLPMPFLSILSPKDPEELSLMLSAALKHPHPVLLRYPRGSCDLAAFSLPETAPVVWGKAETLEEGKDLLIWAMGRECETALKTAKILREKKISCTVVNGRFYKPFDEKLFLSLAGKMPAVTIEDAVAGTGADSLTDSLLADVPHGKILHFSWPKDTVLPHGTIPGIRKKFRFTPEDIAQEIEGKLF